MTTARAVTAPVPSAATRDQLLRAGLWTVQGLLAAAFGMAGAMKGFAPFEQVAQSIPWATTAGEPLVRFIGVSEFLGALGLVLPSLTRILPKLTVAAAAGLTLVMTLALAFHLVRGEFAMVPPVVLLGALSALVAYGRMRLAPIAPRALRR